MILREVQAMCRERGDTNVIAIYVGMPHNVCGMGDRASDGQRGGEAYSGRVEVWRVPG